MTTPPPSLRFEREYQIRFAHCDPAGIIFFPQYLILFNALVEDWVTDGLGIPYAELLGQRRIGMPIVSLQCDFSAISRMGERVIFELAVERVGNSSLALALDARLGDELRVRSRQVLVTTSLDTHRAIPIPDDMRAALAPYHPNR